LTVTICVVIGSTERVVARFFQLSTTMMPLRSSLAASPCEPSSARSATSHGWSLISAVTVPVTSRPAMMVRPEKAANAAITSRMSASW
jgi:hypothetical protein